MIYLDNAATAMMRPAEVAQAVVAAMSSAGNLGRGAHAGSLNAARLVYDARVKLAALFGCSRADHVVFAQNVTHALNIAINGALSPGDHVITTDLEHNSVLRPLYRMQAERGIGLDFAGADDMGRLDIEQMEALIKPQTRAILCTHASNLTGNIVDIGRVASLAKRHGLLLIVDAAQTAGTIKINMQRMGIDILCFTGHKGLMGPQGTGGLCVREGLKLRPLAVGGTGVQSYSRAQPEQFPACLEAGTLNTHGIAGLSAALDFISSVGIETIHNKEMQLMRSFYEGIKDIPGVKTYGDFDSDRCAIVAINILDVPSSEIADRLFEEYEIAVRPGAHCAPRMHIALGTQQQGAVRFSFSYYNRKEEVETAIRAVTELAKDYTCIDDKNML